jgi:DNA repair exonuclease SbcCD ATPase subunit
MDAEEDLEMNTVQKKDDKGKGKGKEAGVRKRPEALGLREVKVEVTPALGEKEIERLALSDPTLADLIEKRDAAIGKLDELKADFAKTTAWSWLKYLVAANSDKPNKAELLSMYTARLSLLAGVANIAPFIGYLLPGVYAHEIQQIDLAANVSQAQQLTDSGNADYYPANAAYYLFAGLTSIGTYVTAIRAAYASMKDRMLAEKQKNIDSAEQRVVEQARYSQLISVLSAQNIMLLDQGDRLDDLNNANSDLQHANTTLQDEKNKLQDEKNKLQNEQNRLQDEKKDLKGEKKDLKEEKKKLQHANTTLQDEKNELQDENTSLRRDNTTLRDENAEAKREYEQELETARLHAQLQIANAEEKCQRLQAEIYKKAADDLQLTTGKIDKVLAELAELKAKQATLDKKD